MSARLYADDRSIESYKVRLLLSFLALEVEARPVAALRIERRSPDFIGLDIQGGAPVLIDGDQVFRGSTAILVQLAANHGLREWWSEAASEQATVIGWLAFAGGGLRHGESASSGRTRPDAAYRRAALDVLEATLKVDDWLALDRPTIADIAVYPSVALAFAKKKPSGRYPMIRDWIDRVESLPNFLSFVQASGARRRAEADIAPDRRPRQTRSVGVAHGAPASHSRPYLPVVGVSL